MLQDSPGLKPLGTATIKGFDAGPSTPLRAGSEGQLYLGYATGAPLNTCSRISASCCASECDPGSAISSNSGIDFT